MVCFVSICKTLPFIPVSYFSKAKMGKVKRSRRAQSSWDNLEIHFEPVILAFTVHISIDFFEQEISTSKKLLRCSKITCTGAVCITQTTSSRLFNITLHSVKITFPKYVYFRLFRILLSGNQMKFSKSTLMAIIKQIKM